MTRPLLIVTADRDVLAFLPWVEGEVINADTLEDAIEEYVNRLGECVLAIGPDIVYGYRGRGLPVESVVLLADATALDWVGVRAVGAVSTICLPQGLPKLGRLLNEPSAPAPTVPEGR